VVGDNAAAAAVSAAAANGRFAGRHSHNSRRARFVRGAGGGAGVEAVPIAWCTRRLSGVVCVGAADAEQLRLQPNRQRSLVGQAVEEADLGVGEAVVVYKKVGG
jgi:hypothetical protein